MKPRKTFLRVLAVLMSATLMAGYIACRSGATLSGTKAAKESAATTTETKRSIMPGSKSAAVDMSGFSPPSDTGDSGAQTDSPLTLKEDPTKKRAAQGPSPLNPPTRKKML